MAYTVKKLAKVSGVSVRTLHWYDSIGLLKPSYIGSNGYRYYETEQMLMLQQILFYRELGLTLSNIKKLLMKDDFDKVKELRSHKQFLHEDISRKQNLILTIDKTILHLEGQSNISQYELYYGFNKTFLKETIYTGLCHNKKLEKYKKDNVKWSKDQWSEFKQDVDLLNKDIANFIEQGYTSESDEVQALVHKHYKMQSLFLELTHESYMLLIDMYESDQDLIKDMLDAYHPNMHKFLCKAMHYYADKNLIT